MNERNTVDITPKQESPAPDISAERTFRIMNANTWRTYAREHERRAGRFADPFVRRREQGQAHPVEDFLFTYYTLKPGQFKRWHPGAGVVLLDAAERIS